MYRMKGFFTKPWNLAIIVVGVLLVGAIILNVTSQKAASKEKAPTTGSSSTAASVPVVTPTPGTTGIPEYEPKTPAMPANDCRHSMSAAQYAAFINRLDQFETISQMPDSKGKVNLMVPLVTSTFLGTHSKIGPTNPGADGVVITVDRSASVTGCLKETNGSLSAYITPVTTVSETRNGASTTTVLTQATHYTSWIKLHGAWYVNQEDWAGE